MPERFHTIRGRGHQGRRRPCRRASPRGGDRARRPKADAVLHGSLGRRSGHRQRRVDPPEPALAVGRLLLRAVRRHRRSGNPVAWLAGQFALGSCSRRPPTRRAARSRAIALQKHILGARLIKEITLRDGHPFVYQRHVFEGGEGAISVASHAMTKFATRGRLSFSPKAYGEAPPNPQESDPARGRSALAYPSRFEDLGQRAA